MFMAEHTKSFKVKNPDGVIYPVVATTKFHAVQIAVRKDNFKWGNILYKTVK